MSDYTKELEAQIEALKAALDKERGWIDYMNIRKESQKYRRWGTKFVVKFHNTPSHIAETIPLKYSYNETVSLTLEDTRRTLHTNLSEFIEDYYRGVLPKIHAKVKGKNKPRIEIVVTIYLYDQRRDREAYTKVISLSMVYSGKKHGTVVCNVIGHKPGEVREIDEVILPNVHPNDIYISEWEEYEAKQREI